MAEDALKDEPEWTVEDEPDDLRELVIILKEVDITSKTRDIEKEKITEKTVPKKKLSPKQQQSANMSWSVAVNHGISKGEWEKSGSIEAKKHRICWSLSVNIQSVQEVRQQEREQHIQELQDWLIDSLEDEIDMSVAAKTFDRGEEDYEHMLMDLQELSLGVVNMEEGECTRRILTPPTASLL